MRTPQNKEKYDQFWANLEGKISDGYFPKDSDELLISLFKHFREYNERFYAFAAQVPSYSSLLDSDFYAVIEAATDKLDELVETAPFNQELRYKWTCLKGELDDVPQLQPAEIEAKEARVISLINEILFYLKKENP